MMPRARWVLFLAAFFAGVGIDAICPAQTRTLRIVSYNIDDADQGNENNITAPFAGLPTVLQAVGQHHIGTNAQPIDVLGVEELNPTTGTQNGATTLGDLMTALNNIYGAGTYADYNIVDPNTGGGAGPDGLVYNTHTVQVISAAAIGSVSGSGAARAPLRYQLRPTGFGSSADFYMYVSHYKSGTGSTNEMRRNAEATEIRQDADALGPTAHIIYSGDYNLFGGRNEATWTTLTATGNGQAHDPTGINWTNSSSSFNYLYTLSTTSVDTRSDFELVSGPVLSHTASALPGLQLAPDSADPFTNNFPSSKYPYAYEVFGNNGTTSVSGATNAAGNTSLSDLSNATTVLNDLMEPYAGNNNEFVGSDHLPIVADYQIVGLAPNPVRGDLNQDGIVTKADIEVLINALSNLAGYQSSENLTAANLLTIADVNGDHVIDNRDVQALISVVATDAGPGGASITAVPEPTALILVAIGGVSLGWRAKRIYAD
jgi:Dockerin type I domain/PEP-CTERM motif